MAVGWEGGAPRVSSTPPADPVRASQRTACHHFDCRELILAGLRGAFTRQATFDWLSTFVVGQMCREDDLGVTSVVRRLGLGQQAYDSLDGLFCSDGWSASALVVEWERIVSESAPLLE